jgi:hypothetical protein
MLGYHDYGCVLCRLGRYRGVAVIEHSPLDSHCEQRMRCEISSSVVSHENILARASGSELRAWWQRRQVMVIRYCPKLSLSLRNSICAPRPDVDERRGLHAREHMQVF